VVAQWVDELHTWAPQCRVAALPPAKHMTAEEVVASVRRAALDNDTLGVLVCSYSMLLRYPGLRKGRWGWVVLDEGHKISNPQTQIAQMVKQFDTRFVHLPI
jgi:DNA excision repair protein ERCC-6